jgi:hypothetical protein
VYMRVGVILEVKTRNGEPGTTKLFVCRFRGPKTSQNRHKTEMATRLIA